MHVEVLNKVCNSDGLCFQKGRWHWDDDEPDEGYRFIWGGEDRSLKLSRGQAIIHDPVTMFDLIARATSAGWFR